MPLHGRYYRYRRYCCEGAFSKMVRYIYDRWSDILFLEIAVRHYSHYSMILCGGMATLLCGGLNQTFKRMSVLLQMVISAVIVSELEFITGYIFNIGLNCGIWDYSDVSLNLMGQICIPYSLLWMLIAPAMIYVDDNIRCNLFGEERPVYRFW